MGKYTTWVDYIQTITKTTNKEEMKEYYSTKEVAIMTNQTTRNVRYKLNKLVDELPPTMIYKDVNNTYNIHHLLLPQLRPINTGKSKKYAMTFDVLDNATDEEITSKIEYITKDFTKLKMKYGIQSKASGMKHVHAICEGVSKSEFTKQIRQYFHEYTRVYCVGVYDVQGWVNYIGRDNTQIITIDKAN
jgi:hypothetical protein